jgi:hypothetical protein
LEEFTLCLPSETEERIVTGKWEWWTWL